MACARVNRRFAPWKLASLLALAALATGTAWAEPGRSVLVFPMESHWTLEPMGTAATKAVADGLTQAGYEVTVLSPTSGVVDRAAQDGWPGLSPDNPGQLSTNRYLLALYAKAEATLAGAKLSTTGAEAAVEVELADAFVQQPMTLRMTVPNGSDPSAVGTALGQKLAAAITPEVWAKLGTDAASHTQAAGAREAAGQAAMKDQQWRKAAQEFEFAVAADPDNPTYLTGSARALQACGRYNLALARARRAADLQSEEVAPKRLVGELALQAGRYEQALAVYLELVHATPDDPVVVEGLARAMRGQGNFEGSRRQYAHLIELLPGLQGEPDTLAGALAGLQADDVQFTGGPAGQVDLALARVYFENNQLPDGVRVLHRYHTVGDRPAYADADYAAFATSLDEEATRTAGEAEEVLRGSRPTQEERDAAERTLTAIHDRSEALADVGEAIQVSAKLDRAHRFRVLAYNAVNESNFEALRYVQTGDDSHRRRAAVLREAARAALKESQK